MDLKYDFSKSLGMALPEITKSERPNFRLVPCCGNCLYSWFNRDAGRNGYCRINQLEKKQIDQHTPNPMWKHKHVHFMNICDNYEQKISGRMYHQMKRWVKCVYDEDLKALDEDDV